MDREAFSHPENWRGGPAYQLALAWPGGDDRQILGALSALWRAPNMSGPWADPMQYPELSVIPTALDRETGTRDYGLLTLENGIQVGCLVFTILREKPADDGTGRDWLFMAIYRGIQQRAFNFVYSDQMRHDNPWLAHVDQAYVRLAERIYAATPFDFTMIDFEGPMPLSDDPDLPALIRSYGSGCLLPNSPPWSGQFSGGIEQLSGLRWLPPRQD